MFHRGVSSSERAACSPQENGAGCSSSTRPRLRVSGWYPPRVPVEQDLVDAAIALTRSRFPGEASAGAAALRLDDGTVLTSTAPSAPNAAVQLCHETGAICEAHKRGRRVVASVCVTAADEGREFWVLAPCGVCQERLFAYGPDVEVAVPDPADHRRWRTLRLRDVQPHWFGRVFPEDPWPFGAGDAAPTGGPAAASGASRSNRPASPPEV